MQDPIAAAIMVDQAPQRNPMDRDVVARAAALEPALRLPRLLGWLVAGAERHARQSVTVAIALAGVLFLTVLVPTDPAGSSGLVIALVRIALVGALVALAARPAAIAWARRRLKHRAFPYTPALVQAATQVERLRSATQRGELADPCLARLDAHVRAETTRLAAVITVVARDPWAPGAKAALASVTSDASALADAIAAVAPDELAALASPEARDAAIAATLARCGVAAEETQRTVVRFDRSMAAQAGSGLDIMREVAARAGERTPLEAMLERMGAQLTIEQEERQAAADRSAIDRRARASKAGRKRTGEGDGGTRNPNGGTRNPNGGDGVSMPDGGGATGRGASPRRRRRTGDGSSDGSG